MTTSNIQPQPAGGWGSSSTLEAIADALRTKRRIVILTHVKPDGDAVGSTTGLVRALNQPNPWMPEQRAEAWYYGPLPPWLREVVKDTAHRVIDGPPPEVDGLDAVVILDTGSWAQLEPVAQWLAPKRDIAYLVDHHVQGDAEVAAHRFVDTKASAVCQSVAELCRLVLKLPSIAALPKHVAEALYLGIATDTGWFRHSNVNHAVMDAAGALLDAGADHVFLYQQTEQRETLARLKLLSRALASLELFADNRIAVMTLSRADFDAAQALQGDSGGFADFSQSIPTVMVTAVLTEAPAQSFGTAASAGSVITKISFRSKPNDGSVDVNAIAKSLGGGGHVRAAGARMDAPLPQAKAAVVRLLSKELGVAQ